MKLYTQLNFGGNCGEAFRFYEGLLGGTITAMMRARDLPSGYDVPQGFADAVIHARLSVGDVELIGNDVPAERFEPVRSSYLYLALDSPAEAERIWNALAEGGRIGMPLEETFFATRFGQLRDRFGTLWTILHQRSA